MNGVLRILALVFVFCLASVAWMGLGGIMSSRTSRQGVELVGRVHDLWGQPQAQQAPTLTFSWSELVTTADPLVDERGRAVLGPDGQPIMKQQWVTHTRPQRPAGTDLVVDLDLDQRRKGLMWYSLYDVDFTGTWTWTCDEPVPGTLSFVLQLPVATGSYDAFALEVDGEDVSSRAVPVNGQIQVDLPVQPGQALTFRVHYRSRGMDQWSYHPTSGAGQVDAFSLVATTDFADIDFPAYTMSPSTRQQKDGGWVLSWTFDRLVTGDGMGVTMPSRIQPGPLAAEMAFSAPVSLGLFMLWITVLGLLKGIEVHPVNHLFLAAAFFSFHLLFGYTADHLPVEQAFALASVVSVVLVTSYLRLVVGPRFALVEAGLAQLLYLVGFSLAHFWEGFTGLTVTVLGIVTLFALMQLTGRIRWARVLSGEQGDLR